MFQKSSCILFIVLLFSCLGALPASSSTLPSTSIQTDDRSFSVELEGNWLFFDEQLYNGVEAIQRHAKGKTVHVPVEFDELRHAPSGYGTFALRVHVPDRYVGKVLAIHSPYAYSAVKVFVDDSEVLESGKVGTTVDAHETMLESKIGYFKVENKEFIIAVQISSFDHIRGGFANPLVLGDSETIPKAFTNQLLFILFLIGMIVAVGILTIFIGVTRKEEKAFFAFGLFCLVVSIRTLVTVPFIYRVLPIELSYLFATRIEYIATCLTALFYVLFIYYLYKDIFSKMVLWVNSAVLLAIAIITCFTMPSVFQNVFFALSFVEFFVVVYLVYVFYRAFKARKPFVIVNVLGISLTTIGMMLDYLSGVGVITIFPVTLFCLTLNVIFLVFAIAYGYTRKQKETERLNFELQQINDSLDELVRQRTENLSLANEQLHMLASKDGLTGIFNRHYFNDTFAYLFAKAREEQTALAVLVVDLDDFKKYNDYYGHIRGDEILIRVVRTIESMLPEEAIFSRYGGEEFVVIVPNTSSEAAGLLAEQLCAAIRQENFEHLGRAQGIVTISVGGAILDKETLFASETALLDAADQQLYVSKNNGRNQATIYNDTWENLRV